MADQEIFTGQKVWLENRKHEAIPNWMDCYGVIVLCIYDWDEDDDGNTTIVEVVATFESGPAEHIDVDYLTKWDDRSQCWMLHNYPEER